MHCPACGTETLPDAKFCHQCGAAVSPDGASDPAAAVSTGKERVIQAAARGGDDNGDEEIEIWRGTYSSKAMFGTWIVAAVITLIAIIFAIWYGFGGSGWLWTIGLIVLGWLALCLRLLYRQFSVRYVLTNQRLEHQHGLLARTTDRIEAIDMDDVTFSQGPIQRMFGVGTIRIRSSDVTDPQITLPGIENGAEIARAMDNARRKERMRRGLHVESV
jgi:membrane protein YdbS with pleckstrin-like domain